MENKLVTIMNKFSLLILFFGFNLVVGACDGNDTIPEVKKEVFQLPDNAYVLAEQSSRAIVIRDAETQKNIWSWDPYSANISSAHQNWFINPSEVKPVFNRRYILMTASGGAVALIRLSDHKLMFYAYSGRNPHSAEILPDGNIVTANSGSGEINTFVTDTVRVLGMKANTVKLGNAHNIVWDKKRKCIYATATIKAGISALFRLEYNGDQTNPKLIRQKRIFTFKKESGGHDLFPVYGEEDKLWLTAASAVYQFDVSTDIPTCEKMYDLGGIKSICNGPKGILMLKPTEQWWAEGLVNEKSEALFNMSSAKIYKGRWMIDNTFSYPKVHEFVLTQD